MGLFTSISSLLRRPSVAPPAQIPEPRDPMASWEYHGVTVCPIRQPGGTFGALLWHHEGLGLVIAGAVTGAADLEDLAARVKRRIDRDKFPDAAVDYEDFTARPAAYDVF